MANDTKNESICRLSPEQVEKIVDAVETHTFEEQVKELRQGLFNEYVFLVHDYAPDVPYGDVHDLAHELVRATATMLHGPGPAPRYCIVTNEAELENVPNDLATGILNLYKGIND